MNPPAEEAARPEAEALLALVAAQKQGPQELRELPAEEAARLKTPEQTLPDEATLEALTRLAGLLPGTQCETR